ncbi:hypothetical protein PMAYCL1PPCAC_16570, partial [Pristionchus mayeri]
SLKNQRSLVFQKQYYGSQLISCYSSAPRLQLFPEKKMDEEDEEYELSLAYQIERSMYGVAIFLGFLASACTIRKFRRCYKENLDVAARLLSYKISLS